MSTVVAGIWAACGHGGASTPGAGKPTAQEKGKQEIILAPELANAGQGKLGPWLAYGLGKALAVDQRGAPQANDGVDDFDTELAARKDLADVWRELRAKHGGKDTYFDVLVTVQDAGFLAEYVILAFARPGWTIPAKTLGSLRLVEFIAWAETHLGEHEAPTLVKVHKGGLPQSPRVLGERLPPPETLTPERFPCQQIVRRLAGAHQAWLAEIRNLAAAPLAAADRRQFAALLRFASEHALDYPNGVVWVSPKAYSINYYAGFCAVDLNDNRAAIPMLQAAVALSPLASTPRAELAQALTATKQHAAAMAEVERMLKLPMGKCAQGVAWRKRGFIFFEMGKLKQAYEAYQKSLELDPQSRIAHDELVLLARELLRSGQLTSGEKQRYSPPPVGPQTVTRCTDDE